jgi:hypothetical protein
LVAYFLLGREESLRLLGLEGAGSAAPARESAEPAESPEPTAPVQEYGTLRVSSAPAHAQVLMRVGDSPALIEQLPVGVAHEFVALAEGHVPSRAVVPADASWQQTPDGRRIELALQLEPTDRAARAETLGATKLPRDPGTPGGELGSVRVVTSPPGAQVYQLIGFTPDVEVENLLLDRPVELALFLGGHRLERVTVGRESYADEDGRLVADLDVKLSPR